MSHKSLIRVPTRRVRALGRMVGAELHSEGDSSPRSIEVWQWTGRKYRIRAVILLLVNIILFAGLARFTFWLRSGRLIETSFDRYWTDWFEAFDPTRSEQLTLIDYLVYPIPVDQAPWMLVIMGLVLATLTAVPILVAMLYRLPFALIFCAIIGFVALLPWLALTVALCCFLARWRALRFSFSYATALLAMLPLLVYYTLATRNAAAVPMLSPAELAKLYVPWVLAIVAAGVLMGVVLLIAWLVNYRPGAIAPLMAVMFVTPVALFESRVGRDELYYRLIEASYGPSSKTCFVDDLDLGAELRRVVQERLAARSSPGVSRNAVEQQVLLEYQLRLAERLATQQEEARQKCEEFRLRFPDSRYVPNVLYIQGRALDMRIDQTAFVRMGRVRYHHDFPSPASKAVWREVFDRYPASPVWVCAGHRLAALLVREGHVEEATAVLAGILERERTIAQERSNGQAGGQTGSLFAKRPPSDTLSIDVLGTILEVRKLYDLLTANRDPAAGDRPLRALLGLDPRHPLYRANLERLLAELTRENPATPLRDNLTVLIAATDPSDSRRIEALQGCIERLVSLEGGDALPRAYYELGLAYRDDNRLQEAKGAWENLMRLYPSSPWAQEAGRRMAAMGAALFGE